MTALGRSDRLRASPSRPRCGRGGPHAHRLLGLDGFPTGQATRPARPAGGRVGFAAAAALLATCCGGALSDEAIPTACEGQPGRIAVHALPEAVAGFVAAAGDVEPQPDGTAADTTGGWRGRQAGIFARREPGAKATAAQRGSRRSPGPAARPAFAAARPIEGSGPRIGRRASRPEWAGAAAITAPADGAARIRNAAAGQSSGSGGVLAIDPAAGPIAAAGEEPLGEESAAAKASPGGGACPAAVRRPGRAVRPDRRGAHEGPRAVRPRGPGRVDGRLRGP